MLRIFLATWVTPRLPISVQRLSAHHNGIGVRERYHAPLRTVFNAIRLDDRTTTNELLFHLSVKAINDRMGPNGRVPSVLVFGRLPPFPGQKTSATQSDRKYAVTAAPPKSLQEAREKSIN